MAMQKFLPLHNILTINILMLILEQALHFLASSGPLPIILITRIKDQKDMDMFMTGE